MKRNLTSLLLALVFALGLTTPALAYQDFGLTYDETDLLEASFLRSLAYDTFQPLTNEYDVEIRLDVVDDSRGIPAQEIGQMFYAEPDYGYGDTTGGACLLMTLVLTPDESGLAYADHAFQALGSAADRITPQAIETLEEEMAFFFDPDLWVGELENDAYVFENAMETYVILLEDIILPGSEEVPAQESEPQETPSEEDVTLPAPSTSPSPSLAPAGTPSDAPGVILDEADLLTPSEEESLSRQAADLAGTYGCGVYIASVEDFTDYAGGTAYDAATTLYQNLDLGMGTGDDGILLLLSMADRDYGLAVYGTNANAAFPEVAQIIMEDDFLDNFGEDDWYGGFSDYLSSCEEHLSLAASGVNIEEHYNEGSFAFLVVLGFFIALVISLIVCLVFKAQLKSAKVGSVASDYVSDSGVDLRVREDRYLHTSVTRTQIKSESSGGSSHRGGGFSGRSGKF